MKLKGTLRTLTLFTVMGISAAAFAADDAVLTVGTSSLNEKETLQVLASSAGGNEMMVGMMLGQSTLKERKEILEQVADAMLFSEAAKSKGLDSRLDVAFQIKWQTIQTLLQAYFSEASAKWDFSEKALKKYYDSHLNEFVQAPAAHTRHILTETEADAVNAILNIYKTKDFAKTAAEYSRDPNNAQNGGDLGWVEKGTLSASVDKVVSESALGSLAGPVKSEFGWHVIEVLERRPSHQMTFKEAAQEVEQRLQRSYIDQELKVLKEKYKVTIDEKILSNLGGVPAPAESK